MAFHVVFLGSPEFAAVSLQKLLETGATVAGVVTAPDRPKGRELKLHPTPVRMLADKAGVPVLTPADVNAPEALAAIRAWKPNVIVVAAFGQILKQELLDMPPLGCVNVHPSLLPEYRGAAPIQRAIMDGKAGTGVTICKMVRKLDSGDILLMEPQSINPEDTYGTLHDRLARVGADLLVEALKSLASGKESSVPQDDARATYAPKITKADETLRWDKPASAVRNRIRALNPAPGAAGILVRAGKREPLKIWSAREDSAKPAQGTAGSIVEIRPGALRVAAGSGSLWIEEIQSASKARMPIAQWLQGHPVQPGDHFENPAA